MKEQIKTITEHYKLTIDYNYVNIQINKQKRRNNNYEKKYIFKRITSSSQELVTIDKNSVGTGLKSCAYDSLKI